jgi:hypothetical protein
MYPSRRWLVILFAVIGIVTIVLCLRCSSDRTGNSPLTEMIEAVLPSAPHPVFGTNVTGKSSRRPAIQVDIHDATERVFFTAELYLTVQNSRFPGDTLVVLPLNVGGFSGCNSRFVQLPFEVMPGDKLLFNLLDDESLTSDQERQVVDACRSLGCCILRGTAIYRPEVAYVVAPGVRSASEILGTAVITEFAIHNFKNYGTAEYIVPATLPSTPQEANKLTVLDGSRYARVDLRLYGPPEPIPLP